MTAASLEALAEAATQLSNRHLRSWQASGRWVVGTTCAYVPDEVLHAAGLMPWRLRGHGAERTDLADTYFGPFICSLPKCVLQLAGEGRFPFLDGVVVTPGCDSMRRLDECWRKAGEDLPGIVPRFFFHLGVPHKHTGATVRWFVDELRRLLAALAEHFGVAVSDQDLQASIRLYNRSRDLLEQLERRREETPPPLSGVTVLAAVMAGTAMPREVYNDLLATLLDELRAAAPAPSSRTRLMLVGSATDDLDLVRLVEGERAVVVGDTLCYGARAHLGRVDERGDPLLALAHRYLQRTDCPRAFGAHADRLAVLLDRVERLRVEGVVLQNIRFCDLHGAENGLLERDLERRGIPCLRLEREYGPLVETGRVRMRLDAFLERIAAGHARGRA